MPGRPHEFELHAYVDDQLSPAEVARIEAFLASNPGEQARVQAYARQKALLRTALSSDADRSKSPPELVSLERQLARRLRRRGRWATLPRAAAAAVVFFLGVGSHALIQNYLDWRVPAVVEAATKAHEVFGNDAMRPVELPASARNLLASWFAQHLGAEVDIPELSGLGLRFIGGRLLASSEGPMAQLLYQDRGANRLTLYLSGGGSGSTDGVHVVKVANYSAGYWQEGDFNYTVVADMEQEDLREIAFEMAGIMSFPRF